MFVLILLLNMFVGNETRGISTGNLGITPSDVYGQVDLFKRILDIILAKQGVSTQSTIECQETDLAPFHVYQLAIACNRKLYEYEVKLGIRPVIQVTSLPMKYTPEDVYMLVSILVKDTQRLAVNLGIEDIPFESANFSGKKPTDVFELEWSVFANLIALAQEKQISPSEVYAQMLCAVTDARSILHNIDHADRYRINAAVSPPGLAPKDVFQQCLKIRKSINQVRDYFKLGTTAIPDYSNLTEIKLNDVYLQTQIIIAETNLLKLGTGTYDSTPLPISVTGKVPSNVHQQGVLLEFLVTQIVGLFEHYRGT